MPESLLVSVLLGPFEGEVRRCWLSYMCGGAFGMHREVLASHNYFEFCLQHVQEYKDVAEALAVAAGDASLKTFGDLHRVVENVQSPRRRSGADWAHGRMSAGRPRRRWA